MGSDFLVVSLKYQTSECHQRISEPELLKQVSFKKRLKYFKNMSFIIAYLEIFSSERGIQGKYEVKLCDNNSPKE